MSFAIPEKDWKKLRALKDDALNLACEKILIKIGTFLNERGTENHKCYLKLWEIIRSGDKEIALMFDDLKKALRFLNLRCGEKTDFFLAMFSKNLQMRRRNEFSQSVILIANLTVEGGTLNLGIFSCCPFDAPLTSTLCRYHKGSNHAHAQI